MDRKWEKTYAFGTIVAGDNMMMKKKDMPKNMPNKDMMGEDMPPDKKNMKKKMKKHSYASQMDLEDLTAIFVSTGANLNDDVFLPDELWMGRNTIAQKPVNINHKSEKIRGHIITSYPADKSGEKITAAQSTQVQSVLISKKKASSLEEAKKLVPSGFTSTSVEETDQYYRFRQKEPGTFKPKSFRTKKVSDGIVLIIGKPKTAGAEADNTPHPYFNDTPIGGRDEYYYGNTDAADTDNHSHSWTIMCDAAGNITEAYTSFDSGHRHYISAAAIKNGKTCPSSLGHVHNLLDLPEDLKNDVIIAGIDGVDDEPLVPDLPDEFDIVTGSVLYKMIYPDEIDEIMTQARAGNKFVSMETWFSGYDYLVGNKIIARNHETAFLDASLRAKGGTGAFNNEPVKRVLRNLHFGGMGIVDNPANPDSVILASTAQTQTVVPDLATALDKISKNCVLNRDIQSDVSTKANRNLGENKDMQITEAEVNELKQKLVEANKKIEELQGAETQKQLESLKQTVETLTTEAKKKDEQLTEANKKLAETQNALTEAKSKSDKAEAQLNEIKLAQVVAKRKADFAKFDITEADLNEILEEVKNKSDEDYAKFLTKANRLFKTKAEVKPESNAASNDDKAAAEAKGKLETAVANKEGTLINSGSEEDSIISKARGAIEDLFAKKDKKETK